VHSATTAGRADAPGRPVEPYEIDLAELPQTRAA
jgi:hypothetical protein